MQLCGSIVFIYRMRSTHRFLLRILIFVRSQSFGFTQSRTSFSPRFFSFKHIRAASWAQWEHAEIRMVRTLVAIRDLCREGYSRLRGFPSRMNAAGAKCKIPLGFLPAALDLGGKRWQSCPDNVSRASSPPFPFTEWSSGSLVPRLALLLGMLINGISFPSHGACEEALYITN